jgi:hypothetical protein
MPLTKRLMYSAEFEPGAADDFHPQPQERIAKPSVLVYPVEPQVYFPF